jgi:triosephosphate isomerase
MKRKLIAANWKMNTTLSEATILANGIKEGIRHLTNVDVVICPPFPWLVPVAEGLHKHGLKHFTVGAQNLYWQESGAYTGEVSANMLKDIVDYVIIGHSERRKYFHEQDDEISLKIKRALTSGIKPILCVGELKKPSAVVLQHPADVTAVQVKNILRSLEEDIAGLSPADAKQLIVAYEPVWAIGSGVAATGTYANHIISLIRTTLTKHFGAVGKEIPILYGGSANAENTKEFLTQPEIDGLLVGGASLKIDAFVSMCKQAAE